MIDWGFYDEWMAPLLISNIFFKGAANKHIKSTQQSTITKLNPTFTFRKGDFILDTNSILHVFRILSQ